MENIKHWTILRNTLTILNIISSRTNQNIASRISSQPGNASTSSTPRKFFLVPVSKLSFISDHDSEKGKAGSLVVLSSPSRGIPAILVAGLTIDRYLSTNSSPFRKNICRFRTSPFAPRATRIRGPRRIILLREERTGRRQPTIPTS